jgi:CRISPR-associated protein (TIGR02584 family)
MTHADFPRRVLLAVTGLTPQVVTETLYALAVDAAQPWVPTEIQLVSTAEGAKRARLSLLDPATGQFHALCRDYGLGDIAFPPENVHIITNAAGQPLTDIRTPEDNTQAADCLLGHVRKLCADDTTALHVSIAGGRKSMGFFVGYALSLFGRAQDRLSHVLVSDPFESLTDFYYPPRQAQVLHTREGRPVHTSEARVMLAEIPFVRMREGLPKAALNHAAPFASLVAAAQQGLGQIRLRFDFDARVAHCGTASVKLPPNLLAWYAWLAQMAQPVGHREADIQGYLNLYARIVGSTHASLETARHALRGGFDAAFFEQKTSKLNRALRTALSLAAEPYLVRTTGERPQTRYGLALPMSARDSCHNLR